jgi:hypothetical protein
LIAGDTMFMMHRVDLALASLCRQPMAAAHALLCWHTY